jgi:hypothetical protein
MHKQSKLTYGRILAKIGADRSLRKPMRLLFWCKVHGISRVHYKDDIPSFTKYQVQKYLSVLLEHGFVGFDRNGYYYIRSLRFVAKRLGIVGPILARPDKDVVFKDNTWVSYLMGHAVLSYVGNLRSGKSKKRAKCHTASNCHEQGKDLLDFCSNSYQANSSADSQAVSLAGIAKKFNITISTASRWRRRGQRAGYAVCRHLKFIRDLKGETFNGVRNFCEDGKVFFAIKGKLYQELPAILFADDF